MNKRNLTGAFSRVLVIPLLLGGAILRCPGAAPTHAPLTLAFTQGGNLRGRADTDRPGLALAGINAAQWRYCLSNMVLTCSPFVVN